MDRSAALILDPSTSFLTDQAAQALCRTLEDTGHVALFVGGCVRNALLGAPATDIDIATDARPEQVTQVVQAAGYRAVPTGIDHGTVTVVIADAPFEVTTFRRDVATDGRHATVEFSTNVADDARRRDFTMNAIYARRDGTVLDPLGGVPDALARRVRFIENAGQRIREDYLRTLRFFRFHAQYGDPAHGWDADALAGIAANLDGLTSLSAERVGSEMIKLLGAPDPAPAIAVMQQTGVLGCVLPGADPTYVGLVVHLEHCIGAPPDAINRLAALGGVDVAVRLRLSRKQRTQLDSVQALSVSTHTARALGFLGGTSVGIGAVLLRAALAQTPPAPDSLAHIQVGAASVFPVAASDLPDLSGATLGARLATLKSRWLASDLAMTKNDLLGA